MNVGKLTRQDDQKMVDFCDKQHILFDVQNMLTLTSMIDSLKRVSLKVCQLNTRLLQLEIINLQ